MENKESGQSAIEFILTFGFGLGVTFLFVNQAINMTSGYLVHYVNFMAARAYMVHETGVHNKESVLNASRDHASFVAKSYDIGSVGVKADFNVISIHEGSGLFNGTVMKFEKKLSAMPMVGGGKKALFYSESFLGKEPTRLTCAEMICAAMTGNPSSCEGDKQNMDIVLYDNGC